ncbi:MAG: YdcF family protein [Candidatus Yanofskybacteria bacterium]|nr:YdcF family protein [Candidatus Yanofskybacteria bacterium]
MITIYILGGFLKKNRDGSYSSDGFSYLRVLAGYYLYKKLSEKDKVELIVSGSRGIYRGIPDVPRVATVMKRELIKLGLDPKEIKTDKTDFTYKELVWLKKYIVKKAGKGFIVSNAYHLPRIKTMISLLPELKELKNIVKLVPAEKIAVKLNKKLKSRIKKDNKSFEMKRIIASEKKGIKALKEGKYKFT